jgi:hypothetical protein
MRIASRLRRDTAFVRPLRPGHFGILILLTAALPAASRVATAQQLIPGANVNVVGGPACTKATDPNCPAQIYGDVTVQRQNEGSMDCSSRNPLNCLSAGNDYRLVGVAGPQDGKVTGDAWLGLYWTRDGGATWRSTLLPGFPGDLSSEGAASPIFGFGASADPTVRAGMAGLFGLSGIAFNRNDESGGASALKSGGEGKAGVQFFSLFIDDNNSSNPDVAPRHVRTTIVDSGSSGRFLDKPWFAWDIRRSGSATCTIPGSSGVPSQTVPAGNLYVAYATFLGGGNNPHSDVWVKRSTDCGQTWNTQAKLTASIDISQSPMVAINPANGDVYVVWREFGTSGRADRILWSKSTNGGKSFSKASVLHDLGVPSGTSQSTAFDQGSLPNETTPGVRMARTNDYPSVCIGSNGVIRVAFSKRIAQPDAFVPGIDFARIVVASSSNGGQSWSAPVPIDNHRWAGHQFQPSLACTGTTTTALWYDQRNDNAFGIPPVLPFPFGPFGPFIIDPIPPPPAHTIDVRAAQTDNQGAFEPSVQVSRYPVVFNTSSGEFVQLQHNFVNWPLFAGGINPFIGDYLDLVAKNRLRPPIGNAGWTFNDFSGESPILHAQWTDNRDVLQVPESQAHGLDWTNFVAPGSSCTASALTWTRNQNLYTSLLTRGIVLQAEGNARRTPDLQKRSYALFIHNSTPPSPGADGLFNSPAGNPDDVVSKRFRLSFGSGSGPASFAYQTQENQLFVEVPSFSGIARTVFMPHQSLAAVVVVIEEVDGNDAVVAGGLKGSTVIAPDASSPLDPLTAEIHDAVVEPLPVLYEGSTVATFTYENPATQISSTFLSPSFISPSFISNVLNPSFVSPSFVSPSFVNPSFVSPSFVNPSFVSPSFVSPSFVNPSFVSPSFVSPSFVSPSFVSAPMVTDANIAVTNEGTVTSAYDLDALIQAMPAGALFQILVAKLYTAPGPGQDPNLAFNCDLGQQLSTQLVSNVTSTGNSASTSFSLPPGGQAVVTLRVFCDPAVEGGPCFQPGNAGVVVRAQSPNCDTTECTPVPFTFDTVPPVVSVPADITVEAAGPSGALVEFTATATDVPDGSVTPACTPASGSVFPLGATTVTCSATDASGNNGSASFTVTIIDTTAPLVSVPADITIEATGAATAVMFTASASDLVDGAITPVCTPASGAAFPVGSTTVTCSATDASGNTGSAGFNVTVTDTMAPALTLPADITVETTTATAVVTFVATAVDLVDGSVPVVCTPASNSSFAAGTTTVNCTATDSHGNTGSGSFTVTVVQTNLYGFIGPLSPYAPPPAMFNIGSSVPIKWQYTLGGVVVDSSDANPEISFTGPYNCGQPESGATEVNEFSPGNSFFNYGNGTWQFNWKTDGKQAKCYSIRIRSLKTGQVNGPFEIRLKK